MIVLTYSLILFIFHTQMTKIRKFTLKLKTQQMTTNSTQVGKEFLIKLEDRKYYVGFIHGKVETEIIRGVRAWVCRDWVLNTCPLRPRNRQGKECERTDIWQDNGKAFFKAQKILTSRLRKLNRPQIAHMKRTSCVKKETVKAKIISLQQSENKDKSPSKEELVSKVGSFTIKRKAWRLWDDVGALSSKFLC